MPVLCWELASRAGEMAQQVKWFAAKSDNQSSNPADPRDRREPTPASSPLVSIVLQVMRTCNKV